MVQESSGLDLNAELARIQEDSVMQSVSTFFEIKTLFPVRVTTAQQLVNMNDHRDVALVFDMRSGSIFNECNLAKSVNFSLEAFKEDTYLQWAKQAKLLENGSPVLKDKYQLHCFKRRKRHWVFIIGAHSSVNVDKFVLEMGCFTNKEK